ncbi:26S proteasome subunit RPN7-domain-containing protein [Umbelopsis sp. PMI_123]|nr:26S proteasome subunit RPN7-domain-containing protein [Umbelopsis sp. PMI_123]
MTEAPATDKSAVLTVEAPVNLDLESYIANYRGHTKVSRACFIAERCPALEVEAYKIALVETQTNSLDTQKYEHIITRLNAALKARNEPELPVDKEWIQTTQKQAKATAEKLEAELRNYKNNMIKESIRMGHNDLGDHYYSCGELANAQRSYTYTRDYCASSSHIVEMCLNVIKVGVEQRAFSYLHNYIVRAESVSDIPNKTNTISKLKCCSAIAHLESTNANKYKHAAKLFMEVAFGMENSFNEIIAANDVAVYGGLCALATFDREELKSKVIDNVNFRNYLELEPHIRELITSFYNSKYNTCLQILEEYKNDFLLDMYLSAHVENLFNMIRRKALVQYFTPFSAIDLNVMAKSFSTNVKDLEDELAKLIAENEIQARIDSNRKILRVSEHQQDQRKLVFDRTIATGEEYQRASSALLLRLSLIKADMIVK